jgi:hypothetical protein
MDEYQHLLHLVQKMRKYQKDWETYHASVDKPLKRKWEKTVDDFIAEEVKKQRSGQMALPIKEN